MTTITKRDLELIADALTRDADRRTTLAHRIAAAITTDDSGDPADVVALLADANRLGNLATHLPTHLTELTEHLAEARAQTYGAEARAQHAEARLTQLAPNAYAPGIEPAPEVVDLEPDDTPVADAARLADETTRRRALDAANHITNADAAEVTNARRNADLGTLLDAQLATLTQHLNGDHA